MSKIITTELFIAKAKSKYGLFFNYEKTIYFSATVPVIIICPHHGEFKQLPYVHLRGKKSCPNCSRELTNKKLSSNTCDFVTKAKQKYKHKYDYSLVNYIHSKKIITIICTLHGQFKITPTNHLKKGGNGGCPYCANNQQKTTQQYVAEATKIHNNFYDYAETEYTNKCSPILIICPLHGPFTQIASNHLMGCKCPKCANYYNQKNTFYFKLKGARIHNEKYDYSKTEYNKATGFVTIICPKHGAFEQRAYSHLCGQGCPRCVESSGERLVTIILNEMDINFKRQVRLDGCKNKRKLAFDFGIYSDDNLTALIEYQGKQHYESVKRFGGIKNLENIKLHDKIKFDFCKRKNIPLLIISYKDKKKLDILLFKFKQSLGL